MVQVHLPSKGYIIFLLSGILVWTASILTCYIILSQDQLPIYVFQIGRHGARSPLDPSFQTGFNVGAGQLTAQGMRQKYLLGKFNE